MAVVERRVRDWLGPLFRSDPTGLMRMLCVVVGVVLGLAVALGADMAHTMHRYQSGMFNE